MIGRTVNVRAQASLFANVSEPVGVAFRPGSGPGEGILVTTPFNCGSPRGVVSLDHTGAQTGFSLLPDQVTCAAEDYIAVSPAGLPHWPANRVYVIQDRNIYEGKGSPLVFSTTPFATLPSTCDSSGNSPHPGITFDTVGTFGHQMIATCFNGAVFTVGPEKDPTVTLVATVPDNIEGPNVAPESFGALGGCILLGAEFTGSVWSVCPGGATSLVGSWPAAESARFVPSRNGQTPCEYDGSGGAYFQALFDENIIAKLPASDFLGFNGQGIIPSEANAGLGLFPQGGPIVSFPTFLGGAHEGSTFVNFSVGCQ